MTDPGTITTTPTAAIRLILMSMYTAVKRLILMSMYTAVKRLIHTIIARPLAIMALNVRTIIAVEGVLTLTLRVTLTLTLILTRRVILMLAIALTHTIVTTVTLTTATHTDMLKDTHTLKRLTHTVPHTPHTHTIAIHIIIRNTTTAAHTQRRHTHTDTLTDTQMQAPRTHIPKLATDTPTHTNIAPAVPWITKSMYI